MANTRDRMKRLADFDAARGDMFPRYSILARRPGLPSYDPERPESAKLFASMEPRTLSLTLQAIFQHDQYAAPIYHEAVLHMTAAEVTALRDHLTDMLAWLYEPYPGEEEPEPEPGEADAEYIRIHDGEPLPFEVTLASPDDAHRIGWISGWEARQAGGGGVDDETAR